MAAGSVTVAALRHRPRQALLVMGLAAVVTGAATLGPLYARAVEESVLRTVVASAEPGAAVLTVESSAQQSAAPDRLARTVAPVVPPQFAAPVGGGEAPVVLSARVADGLGPALRSRLTARDDVCRHLDLAAGRCASAPGEVLASARTAQQHGITDGTTVRLRDGDPADRGVVRDATVVGIYRPVDPAAPYWAGRGTAAPAGGPAESDQAPVDDLLTPWSTLAAEAWPDLRTHLDMTLRADRLDLAGVGAVRTATGRVDAQARTIGAAANSSLDELISSTDKQRRQARTVIPLLAVQLAVLGVVVLAFVCAAATEARRPEIALARLRGHGVTGAASMVVRELGLLVLVGVAVGTGLGWLVAGIAARLWLAPGVGVQATGLFVAAVAGSLVAGLLAILAAGTPTLRQPLTSLLRRVPPRASALQVGAVEGAVAAAALAGLVTAVSGERGPVALLAPGLLAIAGGLLLAQATIPTAGPVAGLALRSGRLSSALAGLQLARRPALRRLIAIVTVACALLVFAVDAWTVADRNRSGRAAVEAGAPVVLEVDAADPRALRDTVLDIDPHGRFATPVVVTRSATEVGPSTTAVEPTAFARIAQWGKADNRPSTNDLGALQPRSVDPVVLPDIPTTSIELTASYSQQALQRPPGFDGNLKPLSLALGLTPEGGEGRYYDLGRLREGEHTYRVTGPCPRCELSEIFINRAFGDAYPVRLELAVLGVRAGAPGELRPVDLGPSVPQAWQAVPAGDLGATAEISPGPPLTIMERESSFAGTDVQRGDRPAVTPVLATSGLHPPFRNSFGRDTNLALAPDLSGGSHLYEVTHRLPLVPRSGPRAALVALDLAADLPSGSSAQTSYDVWLAADDLGRERSLRAALNDHGLQVIARDSTAAHEASFAREGPTLALRLALLAGLVALVLAAAVLVVGVATSGANRARDLAALRVVGVSAGTVRRAAVAEHLVVAVLGVLTGSALGLVAAQVALPLTPIFATTSAKIPLVLDTAWVPVAATIAGALLLLCAVSVLVGRLLAGSADVGRLRGGEQ